MTSKQLADWQVSSQFIALPQNKFRVFVKDLGDKSASPEKTVLLLHGFPESSYSWHKVVAGLSDQFDRVVLFDMLGYGFSDKPTEYSYSLIEQADVALQVWRALGVTGGHVISHDMGTSVLTELLARHVGGFMPTWFAHGLQSVTFTNGSMVLSYAELRVMQKLLLSKLGALVSKLASYRSLSASVRSAHGIPAGQQGALSEQDIQLLWQSCTLLDGHKKNHLMIKYLLDRKRFEKSRWLAALNAAGATLPIHICWGDQDKVARVEMAHYLAEQVCPQARLSIMPGAGHFCQLGSPALWLEKVRAFYND